MVIFQILKFQELEIFFSLFFTKMDPNWRFDTFVMLLGYVHTTCTSGFGEKNIKNLKNLKKNPKKLEISPNYTVICKNAKKINFFTTTRGSKMCQKLVSNVKFGIWSQKYGVGRNFEFWQKFLPLLLPTEHFPKKCRKMLKNAFFQNWQKSIGFSYFPSKLILKGVFCTKVWIPTTRVDFDVFWIQGGGFWVGFWCFGGMYFGTKNLF